MSGLELPTMTGAGCLGTLDDGRPADGRIDSDFGHPGPDPGGSGLVANADGFGCS